MAARSPEARRRSDEASKLRKRVAREKELIENNRAYAEFLAAHAKSDHVVRILGPMSADPHMPPTNIEIASRYA